MAVKDRIDIAPPSEPKSRSKPKEDDTDLLALLDEIVATAVQHNQAWQSYYRDGANYVWDNQLVDQEIKEGWEPLTINRIWPAVIQEQAIISQRKVTILTQPVEESDRPGADFWAKVLQWYYESGIKMPDLCRQAIMDGKTHGHWVTRTYWDSHAEWDAVKQDWRGAIRVELQQPMCVVIDPNPPVANRPRWMYCKTRLTVQQALRDYPDFEDDILGQAGLPGPGGSEATAFSEFEQQMQAQMMRDDSAARDPGRKTELGRLVELLFPGSEPREGDSSETAQPIINVDIEEFWITDLTTRRRTVVDHEYADEELLADGRIFLAPNPEDPTGPEVYILGETGEVFTNGNRPKETRVVDAPLYPNGRYVVRIGERAVAKDEAWTETYWPFTIGRNMLLPHTWHGLNAVEMVKTQQDWLNVMSRHFANYINFFGDPQKMVEDGALYNDPGFARTGEKLASGPGVIIKLNPGMMGKVANAEPAQLSPAALSIYELFSRVLDDTTGIHDIAKGQQSAGNMTATEARDLAFASQQRPMLQAILLDDWQIETMQHIQALAQQYMREGDIVRIAGKKATDTLAARIPPGALNAKYDLKFDVISQLPFDRERKKAEAKELFSILGLPMLERLLSAYEIENPEELIKKVEAWQALNAMAEQMQQQAGAQGGPPPSTEPSGGVPRGTSEAPTPQ